MEIDEHLHLPTLNTHRELQVTSTTPQPLEIPPPVPGARRPGSEVTLLSTLLGVLESLYFKINGGGGGEQG
jgi:hypothetical protein